MIRTQYADKTYYMIDVTNYTIVLIQAVYGLI